MSFAYFRGLSMSLHPWLDDLSDGKSNAWSVAQAVHTIVDGYRRKGFFDLESGEPGMPEKYQKIAELLKDSLRHELYGDRVLLQLAP